MKNYQKKKSVKKSGQKDDPNAPGVNYRTPSDFRGNINFNRFTSKNPQVKFNPGSFKVQHKG